MEMIKAMVAAILMAIGIVACVYQEPGVYRGGQLIKPEPLDIKEFNSFRFVEKWRISHRWLTGPPEISPCQYSGNAFEDKLKFGALAAEPDSPIFEQEGRLYTVGVSVKNGNLYSYVVSRKKVYGTDPTGKFIGYSDFCVHFFKDTFDGVYIDLVEPDPAKGTDKWIEGAQPVMLNGLQWLRKVEPIKDWTGTRHLAGPVETWVLKIPQTKYWMRLGLNSGSGATNPYKNGAIHHPEKHARIVELFHELVRSVKLEPIESVDISALLHAQDKSKAKP